MPDHTTDHDAHTNRLRTYTAILRNRLHSRRSFLRATGGVGLVGLAGCTTTDDTPTDDPTTDDSADDDPGDPADDAEPLEPGARIDATGVFPPAVDAIPYGHAGEPMPDGAAPVWADAHVGRLDIAASDGRSHPATLFTKIVADTLHVGLQLTDDAATDVGRLEELAIHLDRDATGESAEGDVRLRARAVPLESRENGHDGDGYDGDGHDGDGHDGDDDHHRDRTVHAATWTLAVRRDGEYVEPEGLEGADVASVARMAATDRESAYDVQLSVDVGRLERLLQDVLADVDHVHGSFGGTIAAIDEHDADDEDEASEDSDGTDDDRTEDDERREDEPREDEPPEEEPELELGFDLEALFEDDGWGLFSPPGEPFDGSGVVVEAVPILEADHDLEIDRLELTQVVQTEDHAMPLVRNKDTLARVFLDHGEDEPLDVRVRFDVIVPGSDVGWVTAGTETVEFAAPAGELDRAERDHSANLELPAAWTDGGTMLLQVHVWRADETGPASATHEQLFTFTDTHEPHVTTIRPNTNSEDDPSIASEDRLESHTEAFERIFPIAGADYNEVGWELLGVTTLEFDWEDPDSTYTSESLAERIADLNELAAVVQMVRALLGERPTDQLYAATNEGGGMANAPWTDSGGAGVVSWGGSATSGELVMAHEVVHNVGNDYWGRHIHDAPGPDPNYGSHTDIDDGYEITEVGWDPALEDELIEPEYPELMSYVGWNNPTKWLSEYRWEPLVERFANWEPGEPVHPDEDGQPLVSMDGTAGLGGPDVLGSGGGSWRTTSDVGAGGSTVENGSRGANHEDSPTERGTTAAALAPDWSGRVITGFLTPDGGGELRPSFAVPGETDTPHPHVPDPHSHLVVEYPDRTLEIPLAASFEPVDCMGGLEHDPFTVTVPDGDQVERIALIGADGHRLDEYVATGYDLAAAAMEVPERFERGERHEVPVYVEATAEVPLQRRIFYTPDGAHWYPYGQPFTDDAFLATFTETPGGPAARFALAVSDGVQTERVLSDAFAVPPKPPRVRIDRANRWTATVEREDHDRFEAEVVREENVAGPVETVVGATVSLSGRARDPMGEPVPASWSIADDDGRELRPNGAATGPRLLHRFTAPGTYTVTMTGTDPATDLEASDDLAVHVAPPSLPDRDVIDSLLDRD